MINLGKIRHAYPPFEKSGELAFLIGMVIGDRTQADEGKKQYRLFLFSAKTTIFYACMGYETRI